jgi:hypothetical protein
MGKRQNFFEIFRKYGHATSKDFATPALGGGHPNNSSVKRLLDFGAHQRNILLEDLPQNASNLGSGMCFSVRLQKLAHTTSKFFSLKF